MTERNGQIGLSEEQAQLLESAAKFCADKSRIRHTGDRVDEDRARG